MSSERLIFRAVPLVLVVVGLLGGSITDATHATALTIAAVGLSAVMFGVVLFSEWELRNSEHRLRRLVEHETNLRVGLREPRLVKALSDFENISVSDLAMTKADVSESRFAGATLSNCVMDGSNLSRADLSNAILIDNHLRAATLISTSLRNSRVRNCDFTQARMSDSDWTHASVGRSTLKDCDLRDGRFLFSELEEVNLTDADISWADFTGAHFRACQMDGVGVLHTNLSQARLEKTPLSSIDLRRVILEETLIDADSESHESLLARLLSAVLAEDSVDWFTVGATDGYVQAAFVRDRIVRCEAVNFDAWPKLRSHHHTSEEMKNQLRNLGFSVGSEGNFHQEAHLKDSNSIHETAAVLSSVLHDVFQIPDSSDLSVTTNARSLSEGLVELGNVSA